MKDFKLETPIKLQNCIDLLQITINRMQDDRFILSLQDFLYALNQSIIICDAFKDILIHHIENNQRLKNIVEINLKELNITE